MLTYIIVIKNILITHFRVVTVVISVGIISAILGGKNKNVVPKFSK